MPWDTDSRRRIHRLSATVRVLRHRYLEARHKFFVSRATLVAVVVDTDKKLLRSRFHHGFVLLQSRCLILNSLRPIRPLRTSVSQRHELIHQKAECERSLYACASDPGHRPASAGRPRGSRNPRRKFRSRIFPRESRRSFVACVNSPSDRPRSDITPLRIACTQPAATRQNPASTTLPMARPGLEERHRAHEIGGVDASVVFPHGRANAARNRRDRRPRSGACAGPRCRRS